MRVFLDANVIFSAAKSDGAMRHLLTALRAAGHACLADPYVLEEARRNIATKYPTSLPDLDKVIVLLDVAPRHIVDQALLRELPVPEKDRPVLAAAIRLQADALVTGDQAHFGAWYGKTVHGVVIHSPRSLAQAWLVERPGSTPSRTA